jgi:hypothetical protein
MREITQMCVEQEPTRTGGSGNESQKRSLIGVGGAMARELWIQIRGFNGLI